VDAPPPPTGVAFSSSRDVTRVVVWHGLLVRPPAQALCSRARM